MSVSLGGPPNMVPRPAQRSDEHRRPPVHGTGGYHGYTLGLQVSSQEAINHEKNTRQQSGNEMWKRAHVHRLTASSFGVAVKRPTWTEKGLQNVTADKDLSRVRAVQYSITNEQPAVQRYVAVMKARDHDVEALRSGLVVDPSCPWLGASPDSLIFNPCETPSHGLLEVKCPYSLKGKTPDDMGDGHCLKKDSMGAFRLDRGHDYYYQVLGRMALSGISWTDFFSFSDRPLIIDRVKFSAEDWAVARQKLDNFFFTVLLPYIASKRP
ncbi:uncharacterized protein LOC144113855 isoform X2 [Amblyomma americanum]